MKTCLRLLLLGVIVFGWPVGGVNAAGSLVVTPDTPTITVGQTQQFSASGVSPAIAVSGGGFHTCALLADGTVHCWGRNDYGQLGNGTSVSSPTALAVPGIATAIAVSAGGYHTCALLADGRILCWGADDFGQLGNGTRTHSSTVPVEVAGITTATAVSAGAFHTCAVLAGGGVRGGVVHGSSDRYAAYPATEPTRPADLAATVYHCLGIDPELPLRDRLGRPQALCEGQPIRAVLG